MSTTGTAHADEDFVAAESRRRILEAAENLISVLGIEKVRLRDVAQEAGVSIGKIQHYFANRDSLIEEMFSAASLRRVAEWAVFANEVDDPAAKMVALLDHAIKDRERCMVWLATTSFTSRNSQFLPDLSRIYDAWRAKLVEVIEAGERNGVFRPTGPVEEIADGIVCMIDGLMTAVAVNLDGYTRGRNDRMLRHITGLLLDTSLDGVA